MSSGQRIQRFSRIMGIIMVFFFAMIFYMMHQQLRLLKGRKEGPRSSEAPRLVTDPKAIQELTKRNGFIGSLLGEEFVILAEKDITGDRRYETLAVRYALPERSDLLRRIVIISPTSTGYLILLDVDGFRVSGSGMDGTSEVPTEIERRAAYLQARALALQKVRLEPCGEDGDSLGYLLRMDWNWEKQKFTRSLRRLPRPPAKTQEKKE